MWVGVLFALAHPLLLAGADATCLEYFAPRVNAPRAILLTLATIGLVAIGTTSLRRVRFGLSCEHWRLVHGALALFHRVRRPQGGFPRALTADSAEG